MTLRNRLIASLGLLALILSCSIPQGWMMSTRKGDIVLLEICSGHGTTERWVNLNPQDPGEPQDEPRCPSFANAFTDLLKLPDLPLLQGKIQAAAWIPPADKTHGRTYIRRYLARGPPAFS